MNKRDSQMLRRKWKELQRRPLHGFRDWEDFAAFAEEQGYTAGKLMVKKDRQRIHSRENTVFLTAEEARQLREEQKRNYAQQQKESFESRFIKNWNAHIHREVQRNPSQELPRNERGREVFRYEHPDRVREAREMGGDSAPSRERSYL